MHSIPILRSLANDAATRARRLGGTENNRKILTLPLPCPRRAWRAAGTALLLLIDSGYASDVGRGLENVGGRDARGRGLGREQSRDRMRVGDLSLVAYRARVCRLCSSNGDGSSRVEDLGDSTILRDAVLCLYRVEGWRRGPCDALTSRGRCHMAKYPAQSPWGACLLVR